MDSSEATKVVMDRISKLEPEHIARKVIGYMYLQCLSDQELIRLALGPDSFIQNLIQKAKNAHLLASSQAISLPISSIIDPSFQFAPFSPPSLLPFASPAGFRRADRYYDHQPPVEAVNPCRPSFQIDYYCPEAAFSNMYIRGSRNSASLMDYPVKTCHFFGKGFCKHGSNCRYFHRESFPESYPRVFGPDGYEVAGEDQGFSLGSLAKLELEIVELLKSRRGIPVSIAALPMMYYEKYGKTLQAEGYLTESQRHGKAGYSLTKLLARLKNSVRLIDRPHGQHAVILVEDAAKRMEFRAERNDPGAIVSGSRQIYLTFPAESTFTEEDASNYFSNFGEVQDVRIPCQQRRMFGFVTFASSETVKLILSQGNPHFVCGARVLVKPYREKSKLVERKYLENFDHPMYLSHPSEVDSELENNWESSRLFRSQLIEEQEQQIELEAMRISQLQLASQSCLGGLTFADRPKFSSSERFNHLLNCLNSHDNPNHESAEGASLSDSPFESAVASSISTVT